MEAVGSCETSVSFYETTRFSNTEGKHLHTRRLENLKSRFRYFSSFLFTALKCFRFLRIILHSFSHGPGTLSDKDSLGPVLTALNFSFTFFINFYSDFTYSLIYSFIYMFIQLLSHSSVMHLYQRSCILRCQVCMNSSRLFKACCNVIDQKGALHGSGLTAQYSVNVIFSVQAKSTV
jgi:hypothetical protein